MHPGFSQPPPIGVPPGQIRHPFAFPPPMLPPGLPTTTTPSVSVPPPTGQPPPPPVAFQMNLPRKPLFPAAASALLSQPPPSGPPPTTAPPGSSYSAPALMAGQASSSSTSTAPPKPTGPLVPPTNSTARIVHPQEDLSLEELRSRQPKYHLNSSSEVSTDNGFFQGKSSSSFNSKIEISSL